MARALGRYELLRPLARGGMAEVFLARRRAAGVEKWLVVKRIRAERSGDVRFLDLFVREARLSMSLAHQNIVPVFDFGRIDDQVFLAMERVEGRDLGSSLARAGRDRPLPPLLAAFVAAECCQALDYAHRRRSPDGVALGIVHRDVTPRNVLLSWSGEVKLTDFGIAALAGDSTTRVLGTPAYMAPEQARGDALDARADVYAVGLVLREALTGARARAGDDRETILAAARTGELGAWDASHVPAGLREVVNCATAADADARYADARSMLEAIDAFIVGERAANRGDAPARQLAAWLAAVWAGDPARDGGDGVDMPEGDGDGVDAEHLLSFLDDGALGVIGTGTERSMAATASEIVAPAPVPREVDASAKLDAGPAPTAMPEARTPAPPSRRRRWIGSALAAAVTIGGVVVAAIAITAANDPDQHHHPMPTAAPVVAVAPPPHVEPPAVTPPQPAPPPPDSEIRPPLPKPASEIRHPKPAVRNPLPLPKSAPVTAADLHSPSQSPSPSPSSAPPTELRRNVTINARPWANFTVDDDPAPHQTVETLALTVGPHRIHFSNPQLHVERDVRIDVPADRDLKFVEPLEP